MATSRIRYDPMEYARKQNLAKTKALQLRNKHSSGDVSNDDCTFSPKVNTKYRAPSRLKKPDNNNNNNNNMDNHGNDALDDLSKQHCDIRKPKQNNFHEDPSYMGDPIEPQTDSLSHEVMQRTGRDIHQNSSQNRSNTRPNQSQRCLRNSSCTCPDCCQYSMKTPIQSSFTPPPTNFERPSSRRRNRETSSNQSISPQNSQINNPTSRNRRSLSLLKSKMQSRRKSRSAPCDLVTHNEDFRKTTVHSARSSYGYANEDNSISENQNSYGSPKISSSKQQSISKPSAPPKQQAQPVNSRSPAISSSSDLNKFLEPIPGEYEDITEEKCKCNDCGRSFNVDSFERHSKVCKKVFATKRKTFNMQEARLEGTGAEKFIAKIKKEEKKTKNCSPEDRPIAAKQKPTWKSQSNMLRDAMKANRDIAKAQKEGKPLPPPKPSAPDPSLVPCDHCGRTFNEKAAERHIPKCKEKAMRDSFKSGPPKKGPSKPVAAKRTTKRQPK